MTCDELLIKLVEKIGDRFLVETSYKSWASEENGPVFKTVIKRKSGGSVIYECITPKMIGDKTFERSRELHLETVFIELMIQKL
jgi:hypothetical protein